MPVRSFSQQKAALTRAVRSRSQQAVVDECKRTVSEWNSKEWAERHGVRQGAWPDDWARWQRALDDVFPVFQAPRLDDIESGNRYVGL